MEQPTTVTAIMNEKVMPAVAIDENGLFVFINDAFEKAYGWSREDLLGKVITMIMPPYMRDSHNIGFSRFLTTEKPTIIGKALPLPVLCKDGTILNVEHFIVGEKRDGKWLFAATISSNSLKK